MSPHRPANNETEVFLEELQENMAFLKEHLEDVEDMIFASSLCEQYDEGITLSSKQIYAAMCFWREAKNKE